MTDFLASHMKGAKVHVGTRTIADHLHIKVEDLDWLDKIAHCPADGFVAAPAATVRRLSDAGLTMSTWAAETGDWLTCCPKEQAFPVLAMIRAVHAQPSGFLNHERCT